MSLQLRRRRGPGQLTVSSREQDLLEEHPPDVEPAKDSGLRSEDPGCCSLHGIRIRSVYANADNFE